MITFLHGSSKLENNRFIGDHSRRMHISFNLVLLSVAVTFFATGVFSAPKANKGITLSSQILGRIIDKQIRFFVQGASSAVAGVLTDKVRKHNQRNPDSAIVYLNYAAVDPALTNENCNFWHFRFDADVDMKMQALTNFMAKQDKVQKVYLIMHS